MRWTYKASIIPHCGSTSVDLFSETLRPPCSACSPPQWDAVHKARMSLWQGYSFPTATAMNDQGVPHITKDYLHEATLPRLDLLEDMPSLFTPKERRDYIALNWKSSRRWRSICGIEKLDKVPLDEKIQTCESRSHLKDQYACLRRLMSKM